MRVQLLTRQKVVVTLSRLNKLITTDREIDQRERERARYRAKQCDQIGRFLKAFWRQIFSQKLKQLGDFLVSF